MTCANVQWMHQSWIRACNYTTKMAVPISLLHLQIFWGVRSPESLILYRNAETCSTHMAHVCQRGKVRLSSPRLLDTHLRAIPWAVQRSAKRHGCLISYSQAEPGRELTQPRKHLFAEPCTVLRRRPALSAYTLVTLSYIPILKLTVLKCSIQKW